ncbi:hypothetical protein HNY73_003616 [Argiope bruennichi]|uniref:Uncharacterized protein n=1 Tax=Argiope bruennichi TaxID=94029 RepID=A0A8T0FP63_ARGBR|nr:hypothetical protein HNY73_003616 [Argiope bruennichi]
MPSATGRQFLASCAHVQPGSLSQSHLGVVTKRVTLNARDKQISNKTKTHTPRQRQQEKRKVAVLKKNIRKKNPSPPRSVLIANLVCDCADHFELDREKEREREKKKRCIPKSNREARRGSGRVLAEYEIKSFALASSFQRGDSDRQGRLQIYRYRARNLHIAVSPLPPSPPDSLLRSSAAPETAFHKCVGGETKIHPGRRVTSEESGKDRTRRNIPTQFSAVDTEIRFACPIPKNLDKLDALKY